MDAVHIVGAGGIGCAVGHALLEAGQEVIFVETSQEKIRHGISEGVKVGSSRPHRAPFVAFPDWSPPKKGVILLCVKCPINSSILPKIPDSALLVPIQNGVDPDLSQRGPHVEGIASFVSECSRDRPHTRITRKGELHLGIQGPPNLELRRLLAELAERLERAPFRVRQVEDINPWKYTKLMYNSAISPLAASAGLDNGELLRWKKLRQLFFALLQENYAILHGAGKFLARIGPFHPRTVARILSRPLVANSLALAFYPSLRGTYCSMAGDLPHGPTEISNYNGHLVQLAGDSPCVMNRAILDLFRQFEAEKLAPHPDRLTPLWKFIA